MTSRYLFTTSAAEFGRYDVTLIAAIVSLVFDRISHNSVIAIFVFAMISRLIIYNPCPNYSKPALVQVILHKYNSTL